jgi:hypothetical protein
MPKGTAIYLTNGKKKHKKSAFSRIGLKMNRKRRNGVAARLNGVAARLNPYAILTNGKKRRHNAKRRRNASYAILTNGRKRHNGRKHNPAYAILTNGKKRHNGRKHRRNGVAMRMNGVAVRMNGKRRHNGKKRHNGGFKLLRNPAMGASTPTLAIFQPVTNLISKIPVVGKVIAPVLGTAALGALTAGIVTVALKYTQPYLPEVVNDYLGPVAYTAAGLAVAIALQYVPLLDKSTKDKMSLAMFVGGGAVDTVRYLNESGMLGDGGLYAVGGGSYGDASDSSDSAFYVDSTAADAAYSGPDLDQAEGEAAIAGPRVWFSRFPMAYRVNRIVGAFSPYAGQHGHRWGWLVRMIGFDRFQSLAALPADQRVAYLRKLREYAISQVPSQQAAISAQPAMGDAYGAVVYAGQHA